MFSYHSFFITFCQNICQWQQNTPNVITYVKRVNRKKKVSKHIPIKLLYLKDIKTQEISLITKNYLF